MGNMDVIYINPARIKFFINSPLNNKTIPSVRDGNWDLKKERLENFDTFNALKEHFAGARIIPEIKHNTATANQNKDDKTIRDPGAKSNEIDDLYNTIRDTGSLTQIKIENPTMANDIKVSIDRNGKFLLEDGKLLLSITQMLGIEHIPVTVIKRHYQWAKFKNEVLSYSQEQPKGAYQLPMHPDLQDISAHRKDDRWTLIKGNLTLHGGTVLDIGSNWGYFCHNFEELGYDCSAVENNYRWLYFLKKLKKYGDKKFQVIPRSIFDIKGQEYDIVLALSIFHHFLRSKESYNKLTRFLHDLNMKVMFFEPHQTGHGFKDAYIDYSEDDFVNYIINNSCLNDYKLLGRTTRGRNLYRLSISNVNEI